MSATSVLRLPEVIGEVSSDVGLYENVINDVARTGGSSSLADSRRELDELKIRTHKRVSDFRAHLATLVQAVERVALDGALNTFGVGPSSDLIKEIDDSIEDLNHQKTHDVARMRGVVNTVRKADPARGSLLREVLQALEAALEQLIASLRNARNRVRTAMDMAPLSGGIVARARDAYINALPKAFTYAKPSPDLQLTWAEGVLVYEMVVQIPERLLENIEDLIALETVVHNTVELGDPALVGRVALRFEPIGA